ncbi:MAG: branched-chain amino acid aminotransferase [Gammaproteobacteria bacterium]|jgi:branched-chain amino acid aminotransferase
MNKKALCWINNSIVPADQACVSVFDHGLLYGDGVFEGIRFYRGKAFMLETHLQRLLESADAIDLTLPFTLPEIEQAIVDLIEQFDGDKGYLRLVVTRGVGNLGIDPRKCPQATMFIIADQLSVMHQPNLDDGIRLHIAKTRQIPAQCLDPKIKSLNYLNNILARIEANAAGMDEALLLNTEGFVSEGSVDNIFMVKDGCLYTPPVSDGLLVGVTRGIILEIARQSGIECFQRSLTVDDLLAANECFLTGTGAELIRVGQIGEQVLPKLLQPRQQSLLPSFMCEFRLTIDRYCQA